MDTRICKDCQIEYLLSEYYRDGNCYRTRCKFCFGQYLKSKKTPVRGGYHSERYHRTKNDPKVKMRTAVGRIVKQAIKRGEIKRRPCEVCGFNGKVQAHHADYDKPKSVNWLCQLHHSHVHREIRNGIATPEAIVKLQLLHKEQTLRGTQLFPEGVGVAI